MLGANASQTRFDEARSMLEYGFSGYQLFTPVKEGDSLGMQVPVRLGGSDTVSAVSGGTSELLLKKGDQSQIALEVALAESVAAPVRKGDVLGEIRVKQGGTTVQTLPAVAGETVELPGMINALLRIRNHFMLRLK